LKSLDTSLIPCNRKLPEKKTERQMGIQEPPSFYTVFEIFSGH